MTSTDNNQFDISSSYSQELRDKLLAATLFTANKNLSSIKNEVFGTLMERVSEEIATKIEQLAFSCKDYPHSRPVLDMLLEKLKQFANQKEFSTQIEFFKMIEYQLELTYKLERIDWSNHDIEAFPPVDEVLIYMNYNSKSYIKMLEHWLTKRIEAADDPKEQQQKMLLYEKAYSQLHRKPDVKLHYDYLELDEVINNWFKHEKAYLEGLDSLTRSEDLQTDTSTAEMKGEISESVRWSLSSDQIGLILRAADDARVIIGKSMNAVFKKIVPHIRTKHTETLSASAVRSRSYNAEQTDKDAAINALQKMIDRIKGY